MKTVKLVSTTHWSGPDAPGRLARLDEGLALEVEDDVARRWIKNGIAEPWDGPTGMVGAGGPQTVEDIDAEIARLQQRRGLVAQPLTADDLPDSGTGVDYGDGLAGYDFLSDQQKASLRKAGFVRPDVIANASDEDLKQVEGVGDATIAKLRGA